MSRSFLLCGAITLGTVVFGVDVVQPFRAAHRQDVQPFRAAHRQGVQPFRAAAGGSVTAQEPAAGAKDDVALVAKARAIHDRVIALDTHNDINPSSFTAE